MAHRARNRFALLEISTSSKSPISAATLAIAIKNSVQDCWGEYGVATAGSGLKVVAIEPLGSFSNPQIFRHLAVIRFCRDFQKQVLSSICLTSYSGAENPTVVRVMEICGRLKSAGEAGLLFLQRLGSRVADRQRVEGVLAGLPEYA